MKKFMFSLLLTALVVPFGASAASVTVDSISTTCRISTFSGTASFGTQDVLTITLDSTTLGTLTGGTTWSVLAPNVISEGAHTLTAQVSSTTAGILSTATKSFSISCGGGDPMNVTQAWGLTGHETPQITFGTIVMDMFGFKDTCTYRNGCFDVSKTKWYLSQFTR